MRSQLGANAAILNSFLVTFVGLDLIFSRRLSVRLGCVGVGVWRLQQLMFSLNDAGRPSVPKTSGIQPGSLKAIV